MDHQRVHIDETRLEQVQAEQPYLLIFPTVRGQLTAFPIKNESVRAVPTFYNVETFMDLTSQILRGQVAAQEDGFDSPSELSQGLVGWVLSILPCGRSWGRAKLNNWN